MRHLVYCLQHWLICAFFFYQPASFFVIIVDDLNEEKPGNKELYKDSGLSSMTFCFFNLTLLNC